VLLCTLVALALSPPVQAENTGIVTREGNRFFLNGQVFYYAGCNNYYQMVFAADVGLRSYVDEVQQEAASMGLTVLRTWGFNDGADEWNALQIEPGVYQEHVLQGLDYVLYRADLLGLRLILPLVNNWDDYGGMNQYVEWSPTASHHDDFYTDENCRMWYRNHVTTVLERVNTFNGRVYREDPTVFAWQLANEPRCNSDPSGATLQGWIEEMSAHVKNVDALHMVTIGSEGFYGPAGPNHNPVDWFRWVGVDFIPNHQPETIDFATLHVWPESWGLNYNQSMLWVRDHIDDSDALLEKPVILEEFGKQRPLETRDLFYQGWYDEIYAGAAAGKAAGGSNFWILYHDDYPDYDGFGVYHPEDAGTVAIIEAEAARIAELISPANVTGFGADIRENSDLSVDLSWTNPASAFAGVKIYRKGFGCYPEYDDNGGAQPTWPLSPSEATASDWTEVYDGVDSGFTDTPPERDYYYYAAFAYNDEHEYAVGYSGARDESLCYWLGDFRPGGTHVVDMWDILQLSLSYGTEEGNPSYDNVCDVGPTIDGGRKSRPATDDLLDFEDLIVLAMNYENAAGLFTPPTAEPCTGSMTAEVVLSRNGEELQARVLLHENPGCLMGAGVRLSYGPGLAYVGASEGGLWSGSESFFIDARDADRMISLDAVTLALPVTGDGCHAVARFRILEGGAADQCAAADLDGGELPVSLAGFRARGPGNVDLAGGANPPEIVPVVDAGSRVPDAGNRAVDAKALAAHTADPVMTVMAAGNAVSHGVLVRYELAVGGQVRLTLFDVAGRLVRMLVDDVRPAGCHHAFWDGHAGDGTKVAPGIFFCRLRVGDLASTSRILLLK
jgi:mannan endo-1,4-beta-mannosidase